MKPTTTAEVKSNYVNVFTNEVKRCDLFLATLDEFVAECGTDKETEALRKQWKKERQIWQMGLDELTNA
jgi:hypothetical protein